MCINNLSIKTFQQTFSPYTHTHAHTHTHALAHTHVPTHALTQTRAHSHTRAPILARAHQQKTKKYSHASALGSTKMRDKSKQQYKSIWLTIPDQARIALLILLALSSKALEI